MAGTSALLDYLRGVTFEQVWVGLQETRRIVEENARQQKETDRLMKESQEKSDRRMKKLDEQLEKTDKIVGGLGNSIGGLVETLVAARLWEKFSAYPYGFKRAYRRVQVFDDVTNKELTDIDILLSDTEWVMAVEVKREVVLKDVERHIIRMGRILDYPPAEARGKKLLGAMAGGAVDPDALEFAYETGFFVLELKGESVELLTPPDGFSPKEW